MRIIFSFAHFLCRLLIFVNEWLDKMVHLSLPMPRIICSCHSEEVPGLSRQVGYACVVNITHIPV